MSTTPSVKSLEKFVGKEKEEEEIIDYH